MELLKDMPLYVVQWLLQEYLPDEDDDDYTPKELLDYDPRGSFEDNLGDMHKDDAICALSTIISRLYLLPDKETLEGYPPPSLTAWTGDDEYAIRRIPLPEGFLEEETGGLNGSYDEYIDEHSDADPGL